jgi:archaemetzincin
MPHKVASKNLLIVLLILFFNLEMENIPSLFSESDESRYEAQAESMRNSMNSQTSSYPTGTADKSAKGSGLGTGAPAPESRGTHGRESVELQRTKALGSTEAIPAKLKQALEVNGDFESMPSPKPGDWLWISREKGQTFDDFVKANRHQPNPIRHRIYLLPLEHFSLENSPDLKILQEYVESYFNMETVILPAIPLSELDVSKRFHPVILKTQFSGDNILSALTRKLPEDAFCLIGMTMEDLYSTSKNFVFGLAGVKHRVGIYSFARYDPAFYHQERTEDFSKILLKRTCRVLVHETAHMFGLMHCIYFRCVMNGSNHLAESDARPLYLCPVCFRKLQLSIGFDVVDHYQKILRFYQTVGFEDEAKWVEKRLKKILKE